MKKQRINRSLKRQRVNRPLNPQNAIKMGIVDPALAAQTTGS